jgi:hypothetical protein
MDDPIKWKKIDNDYHKLRELFFNELANSFDNDQMIHMDPVSDAFDTIILDYIINKN